MPSFIWDGLKYVDLVTGIAYDPFVPGVTRPFYNRNASYSGTRNVGVNPTATLTPWPGTWTAGVTQVTTAALYENYLFDGGVVEPRAAATFRNCRFILPPSYTTTADSTKALIRLINGASTTGVIFENCEFFCEAQRPFNGIAGRNATFRRCVIGGFVDGWRDVVTDPQGNVIGGAPLDYGFQIYDSIVTSIAWWYSPTINSDIHGDDTQAHSDSIQHSPGHSLKIRVENTAIYGYVDDEVGTGTPGSGVDAGNIYVPPGYNYIQSQATMEGWRNSMTHLTDGSQSVGGVPRRVSNNASMAGLMLNNDEIDIIHCYLAGGNVGVNALDASLPTSMNVRIDDCTFWNDMSAGPGSRSTDPTVKGYAVLGQTGKNFLSFSSNNWQDGALITRESESGGTSIFR